MLVVFSPIFVADTKIIFGYILVAALTLKRLVGQIDPLPPMVFRKMYLLKRPWFFVTFDIIISHIFPENFIEILQVVQKI